MILKELAEALELVAKGDLHQEISALASIETASESDLSFVVSAKFLNQLKQSRAGAVIVSPALADQAPGNYLISEDPYAAYARASWVLKPERTHVAGVHSTAIVDETATVESGACVAAYTTIGAHSHIGKDVVIGEHCAVGNGVLIGDGSRLFPKVILHDNVSLGEGCRIQAGAVIGSEGFGFAWTQAGWSHIHQTGGVHIGHRVHIGANTTIDCGAIDPTVIEDGAILDNQIQIAHNVHIGKNTAIAGCVGIAGSTRIGAHCQIGGACNIVGHLTIADKVIINAASLVSRSISEAGRYGSGTPLQPARQWKRSFVNLGAFKPHRLISISTDRI